MSYRGFYKGFNVKWITVNGEPHIISKRDDGIEIHSQNYNEAKYDIDEYLRIEEEMNG